MIAYDHTNIFLELDDNKNLWPLIRALESCNLGPDDQQKLAERLKPDGSTFPRFALRHGKRGRPRKLATTLDAISVNDELTHELRGAHTGASIQVKRAIGNLQDAHPQESGYSERSIFRYQLGLLQADDRFGPRITISPPHRDFAKALDFQRLFSFAHLPAPPLEPSGEAVCHSACAGN